MKLITVQNTFEEVLNDVKDGIYDEDKFWVAIRSLNEEFEESNQDLHYISINKMALEHANGPLKELSKNLYEVSVSGNEYCLNSFNKIISIPGKNKNITSTAISNNVLVIGTSEGSIFVYDLAQKIIIFHIDGAHYLDILQLKIFPSEKVIVSVGLDMKIKIWSIQSNTPARLILAHKKEISDLKLIGSKGRNIVTCSKDGTINLIECGSGMIVYKFQRIDNHNDPVNCIAIGNIESTCPKSSLLEFETSGKCIYAGYGSGLIQQFDIANHLQTQIKFGCKDNNSVVALDIIKNFLIAGHESGEIRIWNTENQCLEYSLQLDSKFPVSIVKGLNYNSIMKHVTILTYNGPEALLQLTINLKNKTINSIKYLVGLPEMFQIYSIEKNHESIVVGGRDNLIALYAI